MARRVTQEDIRNINEVYYVCKSYAETARRTGWTASTVSRYVDKNYKPVQPEDVVRFDIKKDLPEFSTAMFEAADDWGSLCVLTEEEKLELAALWKEIAV